MSNAAVPVLTTRTRRESHFWKPNYEVRLFAIFDAIDHPDGPFARWPKPCRFNAV